MAVAGLFAGIGGFELAFSQAGFETTLLVEIDPACQAVLKTRFPQVDIRSDVRDLSDLPSTTTIVTAGFPCQNLSMAGDKAGISGSKSGIVGKLFDLIARSDPLVVIENVYFMLQLDSGKGMEWLVSQFESLGYHWAYRVVDTMGFGLPQRRRRVYMLACRHSDPRTVLFTDNDPAAATRPPPSLKYPLGFYWTEGRSGIGLTVDGIPPLKVGSGLGIPSPPAVLFPDGEVLTPSLQVCEGLQGLPAGWTDVDGAHIGRNPGWRMVGNAVSVPVARWIAERIKNPGPILDFHETAIEHGGRWPDAGWNVGDGRVGVSANDKPVSKTTPSISDFRDSSWSRLSNRAMDGFISRAENGRLRMPNKFMDTLRQAKRKTLSAT